MGPLRGTATEAKLRAKRHSAKNCTQATSKLRAIKHAVRVATSLSFQKDAPFLWKAIGHPRSSRPTGPQKVNAKPTRWARLRLGRQQSTRWTTQGHGPKAERANAVPRAISVLWSGGWHGHVRGGTRRTHHGCGGPGNVPVSGHGHTPVHSTWGRGTDRQDSLQGAASAPNVGAPRSIGPRVQRG